MMEYRQFGRRRRVLHVPYELGSVADAVLVLVAVAMTATGVLQYFHYSGY